MSLCVPEDALSQASDESAAPFKPTAKMERCIQDVKSRLRKTKKGMDSQGIKSAAIAICRSRLKASVGKETAFHIPEMDRERLAGDLFHLVADNFAMAIKGYNFHWNVVSPIFEDLHEMFADDYEKMLGHSDMIAERIRALGFSTPASVSAFSAEQSIKDQDQAPAWRSMVQEWVADHVHMASEARSVQKIAEAVGDSNTLAMLDSIILFHDKRAWMFRSIVNALPDRFPKSS